MYLKIEQDASNMISKNFNFIRNVEVLLDVDFPLLFSFNTIEKNVEKTYLAYVLEFKRKTRRSDKMLEMYIVETTSETILNLLSQQINLRTALASNNKLCINLNEILDADSVEIQSKLPRETFFLTKLLPNRIDIEDKKNMFKEKLESAKLFNTEIMNRDFIRNEFLNRSFKSLMLEKPESKLFNVESQVICKAVKLPKKHIEEFQNSLDNILLNNFKGKQFEFKGEKYEH